jgi:hypothetical protein
MSKSQSARFGSRPRRSVRVWIWATIVIVAVGSWPKACAFSDFPRKRRGSQHDRAGFPLRGRISSRRQSPPEHGVDSGESFDGRTGSSDINDAVGMQAITDSRPIHRVYVDAF